MPAPSLAAAPSRRPRLLRWLGGGAATALFVLGAVAAWADARLTARIDREFAAVRALGAEAAPVRPDPAALAALPEPVRRYVAFAFPMGIPAVRSVAFTQSGRFRRPGTDTFTPMEARQVAAPAAGAFVFTGTTAIVPGVWAVAMDSYVGGRMHMFAKVLSAVTVMEETGSPALDDISRLRFLLEAPMYPTALLPGPHLRWEAIDADHARLVALRDGEPVGAYRVTFAADGRILRYDMEPRPLAGDPARFHGAGEVALRGDYRLVAGMMLPMTFEIARNLDGVITPFWSGTIERVEVRAE